MAARPFPIPRAAVVVAVAAAAFAAGRLAGSGRGGGSVLESARAEDDQKVLELKLTRTEKDDLVSFLLAL